MAYDLEKLNDKELQRLETRIKREYQTAYEDMLTKWNKYLQGYDEMVDGKAVHHQGFGERYAEQYEAYQNGVYTKQQFDSWCLAQVGRDKGWSDAKDGMAKRLADASITAQGYVNGKLPMFYANSSNSVANLATQSAMEQGIPGVRFDLIDEYTVRRLMGGSREVRLYNPIEIQLPKVNRWNYSNLQNQLLQGILQGEDIGAIATRFQSVCGMNRASAIRNARTAVTGARSRGKQDRYEELVSMGCEVTKIWVATADSRTRPEHAEASGQEVRWDEPFDVGGEELMFPCDTDGSPWNIYNCRCTMQTGTIKFKSTLSDEKRKRANIRIVE